MSRKRSKKIVSLVLAAVMVLTAFPFANFDFFKVTAADGEYSSPTTGATGTIKAPAALLVDTSSTTEVVRIAAGQNTINLPDYSVAQPTGVIVKATESGIPNFDASVITGGHNWTGVGYGGETPVAPKVIMKIRSADGSALPDLENALVTSPDINNSSFSQPEKTYNATTGWTTYSWTLTNAGAATVKFPGKYIVTDANGAKHMTGMPIQYNISFDLGNRHYEEYAYSVAKEIVIPNGTFMHILGSSKTYYALEVTTYETKTRLSYVSQILSHNMESGWATLAFDSQNTSRSYLNFKNGNLGGGSDVDGMGTSGNTADTAFNTRVSNTSDNKAKVINFYSTDKKFNDGTSEDGAATDIHWSKRKNNEYKSNAFDHNRTLTTIYMDRNADKPDTLDNLNLRMTYKVGDADSFGAMAIAQVGVRKGKLDVSSLNSDTYLTNETTDFYSYANTPADKVQYTYGGNLSGRVFAGEVTSYIELGKAKEKDDAKRASTPKLDGNANLASKDAMSMSSDGSYWNYQIGTTDADKNNYVLSSGNYLSAADVTGDKYLTVFFGGVPQDEYYTAVTETFSSSYDKFGHWMTWYKYNATGSHRYHSGAKSMRLTTETANSFRFQYYDTQALYRLVNWIETGDPLKVEGSHDYSYNSTYDGLDQKGINPQSDMYFSGWDAYLAAYKEAKRCIGDYSITQAEIDAAYTNLKNAYSALKVGKVKIVANYRPFDASGNLISSKVVTDTFETQPDDTSKPLYLGSEFSIGRPKDILNGNYVPKATTASSFMGTAVAQGNEIGYIPSNSTIFSADKTTDKNYAANPATATLVFNFDYEPVKVKVTVATNNGYNLGDTDGEYSENLMYTAKLFSDVTSADTFVQRMLTAIAPFKDAHFHFAGLYSDKALSNVVVSVNGSNQPVANTTEEVSVNGNQYYVRWAPDAIKYKIVRAGTETGDIESGNATNLAADANKVITATVTLPDDDPEALNADDVFVDYYTDAACTNVITKTALTVGYAAGDGIDAVADANGLVTIYAKFKQQISAVSFDPNGYIAKNINGAVAKVKTSGATLAVEGIDEENNMTVTAGQTVTIPVPVKEGYTFTGWVTVSGDTFTPVNGWTAVNPDAGTEGNTGIYKAVDNGTITVTSEMIANKVNFVATWAPKTYKAVFCNSQTETSRFSTKETVVDPLNSAKKCFGVITAVVDEPVDLSTLKAAFGGKDYPAAFGKNCAGWTHHATWKRQTTATIVGANFDANGTWPWEEEKFTALGKDKDGNIVVYIHPKWQTTEDTALNVYTSLDGMYSTAAGEERVDTADLLEGETRGSVANGDVVDFQFSVQSGVYASSSSFIFAYDSDFYELPADETLYDNGTANAVTINNNNTYIKGIGGANVVHYETVETTANPNILKDLPFNTLVDNGDGTYRYEKSTFGAVVEAANSSSEINAVAPMSNYRLIKVAIDPEVTATAKCVSLTDKNNEYVCALRLRVKEGATGSGAVRFCGELLRTTETVMGDVYIASSKTAVPIYDAKVTTVAGASSKSLNFQNPDVYSIVEIKDDQPTREQYTINLALPYGYDKVKYDSNLASKQVTGATPYFAYTVSNGNLGYTMVSDGETVYYSDAASTEELTVPGVDLCYDAASGKWIVANNIVKIADNQNCTTGKGEKFTMITLTGDEGVQIGETYYNADTAAFRQDSQAGYTKSPFVGMPEVKRTYVSDITGATKDAYTLKETSGVPQWVELKSDGTLNTSSKWTPGYYATAEQDGKTFVPVWEPATVILEWYYDKECENIIGTVGTVKYDAKVTKMTSVPKDLYTGKTMAFNVTDGAKSKTYFDGLGYLFSGWYSAKDNTLVCDEKNTSGKSYATVIATNDSQYYADLSVIPTVNISHEAVVTAGEDAVTVNDYSFKLDADMQAALLALTNGVKKDAELNGETILGRDKTVIHIVKDADLNTKFSDTSVNKPETKDFFITYTAFEAYVEGLAQTKVGNYKDAAFGARFGSTEAAKWTAFKENFSLINADESVEIVFDFSQANTTAINLTFEGKEVTETFEAGSTLVPFILSNAATTNTVKVSDTKYESKKGQFGDSYIASDTMKLEKDSIFKTLGVATFTWTNDTVYGVYGLSHTATPKTYQGLTIHYLDKDATAIGTDVSTGSISSLGSTGSAKYATVPAKLGYTANNWKIVDANKETFTLTANTVNGGAAFSFDAVKNYIKDNGTTLDLYLVPAYTQNSYTIKFNLDGGSVKSGSAADLTGKHLGDIIALPVVEKTGWTFTGWDVLAETGIMDASWTVGFTTEPGATITLKATWSQSTKSVTFNVNGGTFAEEGNSDFVIVGSAATYTCDITETFKAPQIVPPTGYQFKEWNTKADGTGSTSAVATMTDGSTYYAIYEPKTINITYNGMNGADYGTNHPTTFKYNASATISDPTKTGYTFNGWKVNGAAATKNLTLAANTYANDVTLEATWTANTYNVTLNVNGGTINEGNVTTYTYGVGATLPTDTDVTKKGYTFEGWFDNVGLTGQAVTSIGTTETGKKEFFAKWKVVEYEIEYTLDGGSVATANPTKYTIESNDITLNNPTKTGYTFKGWTGTDLAGATETVKIEKGSTGNRSYTATWDTDSYSVTLNVNGGTINSGDVTTYTYGVGATLPTDVTKTGYTFEGWFDNEGLTGVAVTEIGTTETGKKEFFAKWKVVEYAIEYTLDGGSVATANPTKYTIESNDITLNNPTKTGYTFKGWTGTDLTSATKTVVIAKGSTGKRSYTATWDTDSYSVTLVVNGGTINSGDVTTYTYGVGATLPTDVTKDGYGFDGWYTGDNGTGTKVTSIGADETGDKTFYANWKEKSYDITLHTNGGTINSGDVTTYTYGVGATLPTDVTKEGYTFDGWYTGDNGTGTKVTSIGTTTTGDKEFYAKWKANTGSVVFGEVTTLEKKTGDILNAAQDAIGKATSTIGEKFIGWALKSEAEASAVAHIEYDSGVTIYYIDLADITDTVKSAREELNAELIDTYEVEFTDTVTEIEFVPVFEQATVTVEIEPDQDGPGIEKIEDTTYAPDEEDGLVPTAPAVNGYVYNAGDLMTEKDVEAVFTGYTVKVTGTRTLGSAQNPTVVCGTGTKVEIIDAYGRTAEVYYLVVFGDVNGDACCNSADYSIINKQAADPSYNWAISSSKVDTREDKAVVAACYQRAASVTDANLASNITAGDAAAVELYILDMVDYQYILNESTGRSCYYKVAAKAA